jgi:hypothetical protein
MRFYVGMNDYKNQTEVCEADKLREFEREYPKFRQHWTPNFIKH